MKKFYSLLLSMLLLVMGGVEVEADTYTYDFAGFANGKREVYKHSLADWSADDVTAWNGISGVTVDTDNGLGTNTLNLTNTYVRKTFNVGSECKITYEVDWIFDTPKNTSRMGNYNWIQFGSFFRVGINPSDELQVSYAAGADKTWTGTGLIYSNDTQHDIHITVVFNIREKTIESFKIGNEDKSELFKESIYESATFTTVSTGFTRGGSTDDKYKNYIKAISVTETAAPAQPIKYTDEVYPYYKGYNGAVNYTSWDYIEYSGKQYNVSRFASSISDKRGWWLRNENNKVGLQCWGSNSHPELIIKDLHSGDEITFDYEGDPVYFVAVMKEGVTKGRAIYNWNSGNHTYLDQSPEVPTGQSIKITADCDFIIKGSSDNNNATVLKKVTINRKEKGEYGIVDTKDYETPYYEFVSPGKVDNKDRVITDIFGITVKLGNTAAGNTNNVEIEEDPQNGCGVKIYEDNNNTWVWNGGRKLDDIALYEQGTFYIFEPTINGKLIVDGYSTGTQGVTLLCFDKNGKNPTYVSITTIEGNTWYAQLKADYKYCLYANEQDTYCLKGFTYESDFHFPKKSVVIDGSLSAPIVTNDETYGTTYHADEDKDINEKSQAIGVGAGKVSYTFEAKGKVYITREDVTNGTYVSWSNDSEGGAIVVTATHTDDGDTETAQYVITIPYKTHEWVFNETEKKGDLYANTAGNTKDWDLAWKVFRYKDGTKLYNELTHPVFSNAVKVEGDNARFIDATAGLLFEAPSKHFGTNTLVTPAHFVDKKEGDKDVRYWGTDDATRKTLNVDDADELGELNKYLRDIYWSYNLDTNVSDYKTVKKTDENGKETTETEDVENKGNDVTMQVGSKLIIPNLLPGQHIRIRWNRHVGSNGELMRAFNVTDLAGTSMHEQLFNLGSGSHNSRMGHQEFIVDEKNVNEQGRVDVTFELVANGKYEYNGGEDITGQQGWANIQSIKVGEVGEFLETHMKPLVVDKGEKYDPEAETITIPHKILPYNNVETGADKGDYDRNGVYNYIRKAGTGAIVSELDLYPEFICVQNGSQGEIYKIVENSYTGTLNDINCNIGNIQTESFNPIPDDPNTWRDRNFQYMYISPSGKLKDVTSSYIKNADFTESKLAGWDSGDDVATNRTAAGVLSDDGKKYLYENLESSVIEFYHAYKSDNDLRGTPIGSTQKFHLTQKVKLPAGNYRLSINGFYREGQTPHNKETNENKAYIFANADQKNLYALKETDLTGGTGTDFEKAQAAIISNGSFGNSLDFTVTPKEKDGEVEVELGLKGYIDTYNSWCVIGPMKLYRYSEEKDGDAHGSFMLALESRQIKGYNYCKDDYLLDSVQVKVNVYEYDYNVKPYPYTWAMEHFTTETGNNTIEHEELIGNDDKNPTGYWMKNDNQYQYQFNIGYPENMIAWKKRTAKGSGEKVTYAMKEGERMVSGQTVPVKQKTVVNGKEVYETVATVTFGERSKDENGNDCHLDEKHVFKPVNNGYTQGNEVNGNQSGGTFYTIIPKYDGTINVDVHVNTEKALCVDENDKKITNSQMAKGKQTIEIQVKEGQHYKIYADGSNNLGFYGLTYDYTTGGELYVPEMDGLGIIPAKYWDKDDKTITLKPNGEGLTLAYNNGGNTSDDTSTEPEGHTLIVPNLKKGNTVYFAATGNGSITEATKTDVQGKIDGNTEVDIYKYVATQDEGKDVQFVIKDLNIYKVAVSVDTKDVYKDTGYATEAREYPLDMTLAGLFLGKEQKAYTVTGVDEDKVTMKEIKYVPMAIDCTPSYKNGVMLSGDYVGLEAGDDKTSWPLFTTDINRAISDTEMDNNYLIGVVAQVNANVNEKGIIDQIETVKGANGEDEYYYNYLLACRGFNVKYSDREDPSQPSLDPVTDVVVGNVTGVGFYLVIRKGTKMSADDNVGYPGGRPKDHSAYMKLNQWLAKINPLDESANAAGVHQVFFIDFDNIETDIKDILTDDELSTTDNNSANLLQNGVFYTLQGVPVKNPTKGIYIFNGKKVYVK